MSALMSMEDRDGSIWYDGHLAPWRSVHSHMLGYTLQTGVGVFEGVRSYATDRGPAIFRLGDHTDRLFRSAHILQIPIPFTKQQINAAHFAVLEANGLQDCYFRTLVFYGGESVGVSAKGNAVHVAIAAWPWNAYLGVDAGEKGIRVKTSSIIRNPVSALMGHAKACGHYVNSAVANREAVQQGYDEALMLDSRGFVAEGSTENVFVLHGSCLSTPERSVVLEGITRATVMTLAQSAGLDVVERSIARDEVYCADEVFFTGTAAEITPIRELDNRVIAAGIPGPVTRRLRDAFFAAVTGRDPHRRSWLALPGESTA